MDMGPLATWVSGAASTCAVIVALRGHRKVDLQRSEDKKDKLSADAYQAIIKIRDLLVQATECRTFLRENLTFVDGSEKHPTHYFIKVTQANKTDVLVADKASWLSEGQENLFARSGNISELLEYKECYILYKRATDAINTYNESIKKVFSINKSVEIANGSSTVGVNFENDAIRSEVHNSSMAINRARYRINLALPPIISTTSQALSIAGRYIPENKFDLSKEIAAAKAEMQHDLANFPHFDPPA